MGENWNRLNKKENYKPKNGLSWSSAEPNSMGWRKIDAVQFNTSGSGCALQDIHFLLLAIQQIQAVHLGHWGDW
jgi:hypothetical protein